MAADPIPPGLISYDEYLRLEALSEQRHDYVDGRMIPIGCDPDTYNPAVDMAGGSLEHSRIVVNIIGETGNRLKGKPCEVFDPNFRIGRPGSRRTHYPDATIVCGPPAIDERDKSRQTFLNPTVIFEVLSPTTESYDRVKKFDAYRELESLREYVLVYQTQAEILTFFREAGGVWTFRVLRGTDGTLPLRSVDIELSLAEVYDRMTFEPPTEPA
ncbi:MAG TPA: Uma2 family endonuclease [Tepidisphaeraceae bacterium]|jgi:Uma2 family endonuclease